jgi:hypothetical protein
MKYNRYEIKRLALKKMHVIREKKMIKNYTKKLLPLLAVIFIAAGCSSRSDKITFVQPGFGEKYVAADFARRALDAAGGPDAWLKTEKIHFDCITTIDKPDGSRYLTAMTYEIYPWSNAIVVTAKEPQAVLQVQLQNDVFTILKGSEYIESSGIFLGQTNIIRAIRDITIAPLRLSDVDAGFKHIPVPIKMDGRWCYRNEATSSVILKKSKAPPHLRKVVLYQNKLTHLADMLWMADITENRFFAANAYDYQQIQDSQAMVPGKIEIFETNPAGIYQGRLATIDILSVISSPLPRRNPIWQRLGRFVPKPLKKLGRFVPKALKR